jgi:phenylpropionate dioxygenase-like ring-hydroxylating dioxygenase large terminal subunit
MNHPNHVALVRKILAHLDEPAVFGDAAVGQVLARNYVCRERFELERARVFGRLPLLVAHESELAGPGACLAVEVAGVPLLLVRGADGEVRAFRNACRHRGTRLVAEPCTKKAIVCPYHGWTYDLAGKLVHVPHADAFAGAERARGGLVPAHATVHAGFVWAGLEPFDAAAHLGDVDDELSSLGAGKMALYRRSTREVPGNWKLIVDAFLDGYHIRHLHRDSVYRFFLDARFEVERAGDHLRAMSARRPLLEAPDAALETAPLRELATPSYVVFPNLVLILHPDYLSAMTATPLAPDRTRFVHTMLVPEAPATPAAEAHFSKSFELIDEGVFAREDLAIVEAMQRGLAAGANETLLFSDLERAVVWFHESVARKIEGA